MSGSGRLQVPTMEQLTRPSPDGRALPSEAWAMFFQALADRLVRAEATIAANLGQPRVDAVTGDQIFDFAPGTYIARNTATGNVVVVIGNVVKATWTP